MRLKLKYKYKKIFWLLLGFICACCFINKIHALDYSDYSTYVDYIWSDIEGKTMVQAGFIQDASVSPDNTVILHREDYPLLSISPYGPSTSYPSWVVFTFIDDMSNFNYYNYINNSWRFRQINGSEHYHVLSITVDTSNSSIVRKAGADVLSNYATLLFYNTANLKAYTSFDVINNNNNSILIEQSFVYSTTSLPDYLNGYTKISFTSDDRYYMLSGLSTGSVFIPTEDFNNYGGRLSYYDNDLSSQPYTSYIQDFYKMPDGQYVRQDFDLSSYYGADFVMFSKYIYLEGEDDIFYDIWVPNDITYSDVTITPNSQGGNDFSFQYKDSNGDIQNETTSSVDLTSPQPLLSDVFNNFTTNFYGLSSIILSPISFLESVNSATCTPINIPNPIGSTSITLPCMTPIYQEFGGNFFTLYQTITTGFIAYYVGLGYFNLIKGLKDPSDDRIEVIHL